MIANVMLARRVATRQSCDLCNALVVRQAGGVALKGINMKEMQSKSVVKALPDAAALRNFMSAPARLENAPVGVHLHDTA